MAVMEAQQWCDKPENRQELAAIMAKRQWINAPIEDIIDRTNGKFDYGLPGKVVENSPHIMKYWKDHASYPFQSHELWFLTEDIRWGKFEPTLDTHSADQEGQSRRYVARRRKNLGVAAAEIPASTSRGVRNILRRQGFRSRESRLRT